jgi:hypothetical protein
VLKFPLGARYHVSSDRVAFPLSTTDYLEIQTSMFLSTFVLCSRAQTCRVDDEVIWFKDSEGRGGRMMTSIEQDRFLNQREVCCIEYNGLDVEGEREIFEVITFFSHIIL